MAVVSFNEIIRLGGVILASCLLRVTRFGVYSPAWREVLVVREKVLFYYGDNTARRLNSLEATPAKEVM